MVGTHCIEDIIHTFVCSKELKVQTCSFIDSILYIFKCSEVKCISLLALYSQTEKSSSIPQNILFLK